MRELDGVSANFTGLVIGWIEAKICKSTFVGKLALRSTQCTPLHRSLSPIASGNDWAGLAQRDAGRLLVHPRGAVDLLQNRDLRGAPSETAYSIADSQVLDKDLKMKRQQVQDESPVSLTKYIQIL